MTDWAADHERSEVARPAAGPELLIDTDFDFESECPPGKDPDQYSPTLRSYQQALHRKPLPDGTLFDLQPAPGRGLLAYRTEGMELFLSSDSIVTTYRGTSAVEPILAQVPESELRHFYRAASTIAAKILFPAHRVDGKITINGARGFYVKIADRMDLTLECVRRHYAGESSPLSEVLARYSDFFDLFGDFVGYVDFFLLQDLVTEDPTEVRFFLPFDDFARAARPRDLEAYQRYSSACLAFLAARSRRIAKASTSSIHPR